MKESLKIRINRYNPKGKERANRDVVSALIKLSEILASYKSEETGLEREELISEAVSKIPNIFDNFRPEKNNNFYSYAKKCLIGYLKNYVRDNGFITKVVRSKKEIYNKYLQYNSIEECAEALGKEEKDLEEIINYVKNRKIQNRLELKPEMIRSNHPDQYEDVITRMEETLSPLAFKIAYTRLVEKKSSKVMLELFGKDWDKILIEAKRNVKDAFNQ